MAERTIPFALDAGSEVDWIRAAVMQEDFLTDNYLSDDMRHPVTEIGTNIERAMASNAMEGMIWQDFSSTTYKELAPVHITGLVDPLHTWLPNLSVEAKVGRGYYRTPTLANAQSFYCWLTNGKDASIGSDYATFCHLNSTLK